MLIVIIDLTSKVTPSRAVSSLEGNRFKRTEQRMKRYTRGGVMAEAVHDGPLRVMSISPVAAIDNAVMVDRRWMTMMDFPWSTHMDSESMVLQHTTFVTHRVSVICEVGIDSNVETVRVEWEFAAGKDENDYERVDWILEQLAVKGPVCSSLMLKRLLREAKLKGQCDDIEKDGQDTKGTEVWRQHEDVSEDELSCDGDKGLS